MDTPLNLLFDHLVTLGFNATAADSLQLCLTQAGIHTSTVFLNIVTLLNTLIDTQCVTVQSFVRYSEDDLTGTPQNTSINTRLQRNRIDIHFLGQDLAALKTVIDKVDSQTSPGQGGSTDTSTLATSLASLHTKIDALTAQITTMSGQLDMIVGPPVIGAEGRVVPQAFVSRSLTDRSTLDDWIAGRIVPRASKTAEDGNVLQPLLRPTTMWDANVCCFVNFQPAGVSSLYVNLNTMNWKWSWSGNIAEELKNGEIRFNIGSLQFSNASITTQPSVPGSTVAGSLFENNNRIIREIGSLKDDLTETNANIKAMMDALEKKELVSQISGLSDRFDEVLDLEKLIYQEFAITPQSWVELPMNRETVDQWRAGNLIPFHELNSGGAIYQSYVRPDAEFFCFFRTLPGAVQVLHLNPQNRWRWMNCHHDSRTVQTGDFTTMPATFRFQRTSPEGATGPTGPGGTNNGILMQILNGVRANNRNLVNFAPLLDSMPVVMQATLGKQTDLKIADVEQVLEAPTERKEIDKPMQTKEDVLDDWNIAKILSRPALITRSVWGSQGPATMLTTATFPNQWLANEDSNRHFTRLLNSFNMAKMDVVFRVVVNSTSMYGGILALGFDFFNRVLDMGDMTLPRFANMDPVYLDLSKGTTAELRLPFSAVSQYLSKNHDPFSTEFLGSVKVMTFSDLVKPGTSPDVEVRLYAYLDNVDVALLADPDDRPYAVPQASIVRQITSFAHSFIPDMKDPFPLALESEYKLQRSNTCRVEDICGVYGIVNSFTWQTEDEMNTQKMQIPVHPMLPFFTTTAGQPANTVDGPKLMHLGRHFCYWNGTLEYKIQVACSNVHAGKLLVVFQPGTNFPETDFSAAANPHVLLDVKEQHELEFAMPFASPTAWKPTYLANIFDGIANCQTGTIRILSADPIKSPFQASTKVTVNVFVRAGRDFQFAVPRNGLHATNRIGSIITQESFLTSIKPRLTMNREDFNDLYKVMRRYVQIGSPINIEAKGSFPSSTNPDMVLIPVRPVKVNSSQPNSIGHVSRGFAFWRGSLKYKIKVVGRDATAFEIYHAPTAGIPSTMTTFFGRAPNIHDQAGHAGSFAGSQTFHAEKDKEWEVVVPYYSMYDWLHIPQKDYAVGTKLPLLSTNNGCLVIRPLFQRAAYSVTISMAVGEDYQLACPTAYPPITPPDSDNESFAPVVVQGQVERSYPTYLRNSLFRSAWDALDAESPARASRSAFNKHYYKYCKECECNVFTYLHAERCRPITKKSLELTPQSLVDEPVEIQGLMEFFNKLSTTNDVINTIVKGFQNETEHGTAEYLIDVITRSVKRLVNDASISVRNWFSQILPAVDWRLFASALVAGFAVYALRDYIHTPFAQIVLGSLSALVSHKFITYITKLWFDNGDEFQVRVQNGAAFTLPLLMQLCCGVLIYFLNLASSNSASRLLKGLGDLGRSFTGIKSGLEAMSLFTSWLNDKLVPELSQTDSNVLRGLMADSLDVLDEVVELNLEEMKVRCLSELEIQDRVLKCYDQLVRLTKVAVASNAPHGIMNVITRSMTKMEKLRTEVVAYKGNESYRIDPFHVSLYGPPGVGKSAVMKQIIKDFQVMENWPENNLEYSRTVDTEYWDGYQGQTAVVYDDLAQVVQDGPCDITELIGIKSNAPYMVHMASITEKGRFFTSKFVISSTNVKTLNTYGGLRDVAAFHRRRNVLLEVRKVGAFQDCTDEHKVPHNEFRLLNSITGEAETQFMNYELIMELVLRRGKDYYDEQRNLLRKNKEFLKPSTVAQAITERETIHNIPGVVDANGTFHVVDAEAQALLDAAPESDRKEYLRAWTDAWNAAWTRRDFASMTSCFNYASKLRIISAIREKGTYTFCMQCMGECQCGKVVVESRVQNGPCIEISAAEEVIVQKASAHDRLKTSMWRYYADIKQKAQHVSAYFGQLWDSFDPESKRKLATAVAGMGVIALALAMAVKYTKKDGKDRETNEIPVEAFAEYIPTGYESKTRKVHDLKVEGSAEFQEWSKCNPGLIPYRYVMDEVESKKIGEIVWKHNPQWEDFVSYCDERGWAHTWRLPPSAPGYQGETWLTRCYDFFYGAKAESGIDDFKTRRGTSKTILVESGIDDHKTRRGGSKLLSVESGIDDYRTRRGDAKRIVVEGSLTQSAMASDVPKEILSLSEEDLMTAMRSVQEKGDVSKTITTLLETYDIEGTAQATTDEDAASFIDNTVLDNLALVFQPKSTIRMRGILLEDRFLAVPKHFFRNVDASWEQGDRFLIRVREKVYEQSFDAKSVYIVPNRDLAVYLLSARVAGARSILKRVADKDEHARFRETSGSLVGLASNTRGQTWVKQRGLPTILAMTEADHMRVQYKIGQENHILKGYRYYADTVNGECGSLLIQNNRFMYGKIIGFHVAASLGRQLAFSELLVRSELETAIRVLTSDLSYVRGGSSVTVLEELHAQGIIVQGSIAPAFANLHPHIDIAGKLDPKLVRRSPGKTEIRPSAIQGIVDIQPKTEPAVLSRSDPRCPKGYDPLVGAVNKFSKPALPFRKDHLRAVQDHMVNTYRKYSGYVNKRVLGLNEAINGIPQVEYADAINMKSAEGAFWNSERPLFAHNKEWMFRKIDITNEDGTLRQEYRIDHKPLLAKLVFRLQQAQKGERVMSVTQECLKDERRGLNKIYCDEPATRCFTIMPVDYTILVRQYFWDFAAMLMKNRGELGPQVGINPLSIEWTQLMCRLKAKSSKGFAGDYKNYDSQEMAELMDNACDIINRWYDDGEVNARVRKVLFQEGFDRYSMVYDALVHIDQGLPSGFPLTALVNSMNNDQYKYLAWLSLAPADMKSLTTCDECVDRISYGDDHADAVVEKALGFYNQQTFGKFLEDYGITYTDAHKNSWKTAAPFEPIEGVSFLKRLFVPHPDYKRFYLAPLEKKSIEDRVLWTTTSKYASDDELLCENIKNSMQDAYHWGPIYFEQLYAKMLNALKVIGKEHLMKPVSYTSEDIQWISTVPGMGEFTSPLTKDIFGF